MALDLRPLRIEVRLALRQNAKESMRKKIKQQRTDSFPQSDSEAELIQVSFACRFVGSLKKEMEWRSKKIKAFHHIAHRVGGNG